MYVNESDIENLIESEVQKGGEYIVAASIRLATKLLRFFEKYRTAL